MYVTGSLDKNAVVRKAGWLCAVLCVIATIKVFILKNYAQDLHSEEAQYWVWSRHLQLSYYSKPPMIAYLNRLSTDIFGNTVFGIRINALVTGILVSFVTFFLAYELFKNSKTALFAAIVTCIFPFLISISVCFSTDTPLILFWLCGLWFFWKALHTDKLVWWILFGVTLGLGALSKYSMFLILIPLLLFVARHQPRVFRNGYFYLALVVGLSLFSPVIYWNYKQGGIGLMHLFYLSGVSDHTHSLQPMFAHVLEFVAGQLAILLPFYQYPTIYRRFRKKTLTPQEEYLILPAVCMFLIFLVVAAVRHSGADINWAMFAYTGIPVLFAHYVISRNKPEKTFTAAGIMLGLLILFSWLTSPMNTVVPLGKNNPANKMVGWSTMAAKVDSIRGTLPANDSYVFSTNYHIASELWFYLKGQPQTYVLNLHSRMTQFDLWPGIEQFERSNKLAVYVDYDPLSPELMHGFSSVIKQDSVTIYNQNSAIDKYYIYVLGGLKGFPKRHAGY
jgi:4-amino-4-deoxy-L-arabinose transferase-like glycosyltransferase